MNLEEAPYILNESVINAFLKMFGLRIEQEGPDFKPGRVLEILSEKEARGVVFLEQDSIIIEAYTELGKLEASYQVNSNLNNTDNTIRWNVPIDYSIKRQFSNFKGKTLMMCTSNSEKGFQASSYNLLECYVNGEIQTIVKLNQNSFAVENYKHAVDYTTLDKVEMKPFDTKNGYISHETFIKEDELEGYRQTLYSGIFVPEDEELKEMFQAFKIQRTFGRCNVNVNELYSIESKDDESTQTRVTQMGRLMGELNPNTYILLKDIRSSLNLGKTSLLDGLIDSSLNLQDEEFQALFGATRLTKSTDTEAKKMDFKPID